MQASFGSAQHTLSTLRTRVADAQGGETADATLSAHASRALDELHSRCKVGLKALDGIPGLAPGFAEALSS